MALSNQQYREIVRGYDEKQLKNERDLSDRIRTVYQKVPAIEEIDKEISSLALTFAKRMIHSNEQKVLHVEFTRKRQELAEEKNMLLIANGFPADFMDKHYKCSDCQDTGFIMGKKCRCFYRAQMELYYEHSHLKEILQKENFSKFCDCYYDDTEVNPSTNMTNKAYMHTVIRDLKAYVKDFENHKGNVLFTGTAGVGKTFLSNCIARDLLERGFGVVYVTAEELFAELSKNMYERENEGHDDSMVSTCDLLVIDDLGTELKNSFTRSKLFAVINERLLKRQGTIISTNLNMETIAADYSERVSSRLISCYKIIHLFGDDIRIKKRLLAGRT